jgi:hypothetical protein
MDDFSVKVERVSIETDPSIDVFEVVVTKKGTEGVWCETIPTEDNLYWFHRGMQAVTPPLAVSPMEIPRREQAFRRRRERGQLEKFSLINADFIRVYFFVTPRRVELRFTD